MTCCSRKIIEQIKIVGKIDGLNARNGVNYTPDGYLEFGGPLVHDTVVNGNYNLSFGSYGSNIKYFSVSSNTTIYLEANNGSVGSFINIENSKILIGSSSPGSGGIMGLHDYRAGMTDGRYYVQKMYVDNVIAGKPIVSAVANPGADEHTKSIAWNNDIGHWTMQAAGAAPTAGSPTQVIYNDAGALVGHENFTFTPVTNFLSVPSISLGHALLGGNYRYLTAQGSEAVISILLQPKGIGSIVLGAYTGAILLGADNSPNTVQRLMARGAGAQVDIALEVKGTDGKVFIGDKDEVGAYRRIQARGYNPSLNLMLQSKGVGDVILDPDPDATGGGVVRIGVGSAFAVGIKARKIYASSDFTIAHLEVGGDGGPGGNSFMLLIGSSSQPASQRYISVASSALDTNLHLNAKGLGRVFVNGYTTIKYTIGDWDMVSVVTKNVAHTIPDHTKILAVDVVIVSNVGDRYPLNKVGFASGALDGGGIYKINTSNITLTRIPSASGGFFANSSFGGAGNRGWIYITYEA